MQRLTRLPRERLNAEVTELLTHFREIKTILVRHLPPSIATLFAQPIIKGNMVEWYSELEGQPKLVTTPNAKIDDFINQQLHTIRALAQHLTDIQAIEPEQVRWLTELVQAIQSKRRVYLVNERPVVVDWGVDFSLIDEPVKDELVITKPDIPKIVTKRTTLRHIILPLFLLLSLLAFGIWWFSTPPLKPIEKALSVGKKWEGKFYCNGKMALMTVEVIERKDDQVVALEHFDYGGCEKGIVYLEGTFTDKIFNARETKHHTKPTCNSWTLGEFKGTYNAERNMFLGDLLLAGCTVFEMHEIQ